MLDHPGKLLAEYLARNWYTQKSFSEKIWKRVSEINEIIKWKRNITVAWDIIFSKQLSTEPKFWVIKQIDYDYEQALLQAEGNSIKTISHENKKNSKEEKLQEVQIENPFLEDPLLDPLTEEMRQNKYLRENVFKETPLENNVKKEEIIEKKQKPKKTVKSKDIRELLKEEPIIQENNNSLKEVFESF